MMKESTSTQVARTSARSVARVLAAIAALAATLALACESETGPDAPPRQNGCIDLGCAPTEPGDAGPDGESN